MTRRTVFALGGVPTLPFWVRTSLRNTRYTAPTWLGVALPAVGPAEAEGVLRLAGPLDGLDECRDAGELPGADDEAVMIASHHDGPWSSAVEDSSGIALVLAQATYWAAQPVEDRRRVPAAVVRPVAPVTDRAGRQVRLSTSSVRSSAMGVLPGRNGNLL